MKQAKITVDFYNGLGVGSPFHLKKNYILRNWQDEAHLKNLLDELASELAHLSGYGIDHIQVKQDEHQFKLNYRDTVPPYINETLDNHHYLRFRYSLSFVAGRSMAVRRSGDVFLEIPRINIRISENESIPIYHATDMFFQVKGTRAYGNSKSLVRLQYDMENPYLVRFVKKLANGLLLPNTSLPISPKDKLSDYLNLIQWWYLPESQTSLHKLKKQHEKEEAQRKAEERKQKNLAKSGIVYKDKKQRTKASQVYIVHMEGEGLAVDMYKIGISNAPRKRLQSLNTSNPFSLTIVHKFVAEPAQEAEAKLHTRFQEARMSGEWFKLSPEQINSLKRIVAYRDGEFVEASDTTEH